MKGRGNQLSGEGEGVNDHKVCCMAIGMGNLNKDQQEVKELQGQGINEASVLTLKLLKMILELGVQWRNKANATVLGGCETMTERSADKMDKMGIHLPLLPKQAVRFDSMV